MRIYLYILAGLTSALIGQSIGQSLVTDVGILSDYANVVIFPCVAISLAVGMVLNEIFLSTPTRPKLNFRLAPRPLIIAAALGLIAGLFGGGLTETLFFSNAIPAPVIRTLGWVIIGSSVGFAEGFTWRWRSIEAGNQSRFHQRLKTSVLAGTVAGLATALVFELIRIPLGAGLESMAELEDPLGFSILGILLGLAFSLTISPSYMVALRAGAGFEYIDRRLTPESSKAPPPSPKISNSLCFISSNIKDIEEGLSIQLPGAGRVRIGSATDADIFIPHIAEYAAQIDLQARTATITALEEDITVSGETVTQKQSKSLRHNHILTFTVNQPINNDEENLYRKKLYRFVYYNRFLDPQA